MLFLAVALSKRKFCKSLKLLIIIVRNDNLLAVNDINSHLILGGIMNTGKLCIIVSILLAFLSVGCSSQQNRKSLDENIDDYGIWLAEQKLMLEKIVGHIVNLPDKMAVENELVRLVNEGLNVEDMFVGFSDGTIVTGYAWMSPDSWDSTIRPWYILAMSANGNAIATEIFDALVTGTMLVTIAKNIGVIDGLTAVFAANIVVPYKFFEHD
jgi:hypothetical protein